MWCAGRNRWIWRKCVSKSCMRTAQRWSCEVWIDKPREKCSSRCCVLAGKQWHFLRWPNSFHRFVFSLVCGNMQFHVSGSKMLKLRGTNLPLLRDGTCQRKGMCLVWIINERGMYTLTLQCASLWSEFESTWNGLSCWYFPPWSIGLQDRAWVKFELSQWFWLKFAATTRSQTLGLRYNYIYVPWTTDGASNIGLAWLRCIFCCLQTLSF